MARRIAILATEKAIVGGMITLIETFEYCNIYWQLNKPEAKEPLFECVIVSPNGEPITNDLGVRLNTISLIDANQLKEMDAVIVASMIIRNEECITSYLRNFAPFTHALLEFKKLKRPISAYCTGSLALASTGLLNEHQATCAWWLSTMFTNRYPKVILTMNKIVVADKGMFTAGAASANLSLALVLVRELVSEKLANRISKLLLIDPNRSSQMPFMDRRLVPEHKDELIHNVQNWMQKNLLDNSSVEELAQRFAVSGRTLIRRFKSATTETPAAYRQRLRIEEAKILIETTQLSIEKIANAVGYEDISAFRKSFTKLTSLSPNAYRNRFKTTAVT
ncbi:transcriptional regulator, AraC family [Pseudoalteromonas luteoviolacea B = ATCC 29581]|nr:transcriptional regulator, AraC family [Pseudoalteromonas luteoviolacea B = ATCC 29581]